MGIPHVRPLFLTQGILDGSLTLLWTMYNYHARETNLNLPDSLLPKHKKIDSANLLQILNKMPEIVKVPN